MRYELPFCVEILGVRNVVDSNKRAVMVLINRSKGLLNVMMEDTVE